MTVTRASLSRLHLSWVSLLVSLAVACGGSGTGSEPGWQPPELLARNGPPVEDLYDGQYPPDVHLAVNARGEAFATWERVTPPAIVVSRYQPGSGWQAPTAINTDSGVTEPDVAITADGAAAVVWAGGPPWVSTFWSRNVGSGWSAPERIQEAPSAVQPSRGRGNPHPFLLPGVVLTAADSASAFWYQAVLDPSVGYVGGLRKRLAARSFAEGDWGETVFLDAWVDITTAFPNGTLITAWRTTDGAETASYRPSRGWATPQFLGPAPTAWIAVAAGRDGSAAAFWASGTFDTSAGPSVRHWYTVFADRPGQDWSNREELQEAGDQPGLAIDGLGTAWLVYSSQGGMSARSRARNGQWSPARLIGAPAGDPPSIAFDDLGNGVAVWRRGGQVWAARFDAHAGWQPPLQLQGDDQDESVTGPSGSAPRVAMDGRGNALAVWSEMKSLAGSGAVTIWACRFER